MQKSSTGDNGKTTSGRSLPVLIAASNIDKIMKILVTGSSGHLGEALVRMLWNGGHEVTGLDILESEFTNHKGTISDRKVVRRCMDGVEAVFHAATLHKPHVLTHQRQNFVDTNITGTLNLLEEAAQAGIGPFIFTSTTSVFGAALTPPPDFPAAWITEDTAPIPKNIYGITKHSAENLCESFYRNHGLTCIVLRTSRFFPEEDDNAETRLVYEDGNIKANEFLYRRVDLEDVVNAHLLALQRASMIGFGRYIISATTPFMPEDVFELRVNAPAVLERRVPEYTQVYERLGWKMFAAIDRVYDAARARIELGWQPKYDFRYVLACLARKEDPRSPVARMVGSKGYHSSERNSR